MEHAKWLVFENCDAPLASKTFYTNGIKRAGIKICGLGFFELYINGKKVSDDLFTPVWSDYEPRENRRMLYPIHDSFTHRVYYREYDIQEFIADGDNTLDVLLGNGWYNQRERNVEGDFWYGNPKLCFSLKMYDEAEREYEVISDETMNWKASHIVFNNVYMGECQDFRMKDEDIWFPCKAGEAPKGELCLQICPPDKAIRVINPKLLYSDEKRRVYDAGENISGYVRCLQEGERGSRTILRFSENLNADMSLNYHSTGGTEQIQTDECISNGEANYFEPKFTWHGFRYFEVIGNAKNIEVVVVHSDVKVSSSFLCDSSNLNWLYESYIRTQLNNMHCGIVSDCPHRERLGYTGDGQLCCDAAMMLLGSRELYKKWIRDIADSQDKINGHVQHTAPFNGGGGGPGGWGCAIVAVPYYYYKHFGEKERIKEYLPNMHKWISYMESRSDNHIVTREEEGGWCLGDWCTPDKVSIPESFVNTYYLIRSLIMMTELTEAIGQNTEELIQKTERIKRAFLQSFYDEETNSYCHGVQGENAFALDLGLGNEEMLIKLAEYYDSLGEFDTGIFGTDIVLKVLFENGYEDVAYRLLTSEKPNSFGYQKNMGATTIWESWNGDASHDHPMFGACSRYLFTYLLGIRQKTSSAAYKEVVIEPKIPKALQQAKGSIVSAAGKIEVAWQKEEGTILFEIAIPKQCTAAFRYGTKERRLHEGKTSIRCSIYE